MYYLLNSREMKECDKNTIEYYGISSLVLMERAALSVYREIQKRIPFETVPKERVILGCPLGIQKETRKILVLCGAGNNGGDGFAIARLLYLAGYDVKILFPMDEGKMTPETKAQYYSAKQYHIPMISDVSETSFSVIVDALFGIGLSRKIEGKLKNLLHQINQMSGFKIAVDISSGIETDTGHILGTAFCADLTVTFGFAKIGQLLYPGASYTGELIVSDMGIDAHSLLEKKPAGFYFRQDCRKELLPKRRSYSNKGSYGKALIIAGSSEMAGAAYFAAKAAYYSGCGLVRILTAEENREILLTKLPEAIITTYGADQPEVSDLEDCISWANAVLIGPGISQNDKALWLVRKTLQYKAKKMVIDADALNLTAKDKTMLKGAEGAWILTPHLGEMSRLTGRSVTEIQEDLLRTALDFAEKYRIYCVLKDARTIIGMPEGDFFVNTVGNHGMATGGSGDVLAGFLTGFLAQGLDCKWASVLAVYLHGMAGDFAKEKRGAHGMIASDLLEMLPETIKEEKE